MWLSVVSQTLTKKWTFLLSFRGSPVVKTLPSNAGGEGSIPGQEAKIPHASGPKTKALKKKKKTYLQTRYRLTDIDNKILPCSTGNYIQYPVINHNKRI